MPGYRDTLKRSDPCIEDSGCGLERHVSSVADELAPVDDTNTRIKIDRKVALGGLATSGPRIPSGGDDLVGATIRLGDQGFGRQGRAGEGHERLVMGDLVARRPVGLRQLGPDPGIVRELAITCEEMRAGLRDRHLRENVGVVVGAGLGGDEVGHCEHWSGGRRETPGSLVRYDGAPR